jgi:hypothetical protein
VLALILSSPPFRNTQQCQSLLRYVVKHSLAGEDNLLRERVIGSEVFGRRPNYEPGEDPVVRLRAAEVRKRLAQYYQSVHDDSEIQIEIPAGSYRAIFRHRDEALLHQPSPMLLPEHAASDHDTQPSAHAGDARSLPHRIMEKLCQPSYRYGIAAALLLMSLLAALASDPWNARQNARFYQFWEPWTGSSKPVILVIGRNAVYRLSDKMMDDYAEAHHLGANGEEFFVPLMPDQVLHGRDLTAADDSFVALGDVAAVSHLVASLTRQGQDSQERFHNDISFAELRDTPSLLIGGFNNPMTIELTKNLRYVLRFRNEIDDTETGKEWLLHASQDAHDTEDYAIVTRLTQRGGEAPILSVAGMGQYGTMAAADFACDPKEISSVMRTVPKGWEHRNLQIVLHVKVVDFKPAATNVVASYVW